MKRLSFALEAKVTELSNIPMFDGTKCFMVCTLSNDKIKNNYKGLHVSNYTSSMINIKNHRARFGDLGIYDSDFKLLATSSNNGDYTLPNKWLGISFLIKHDKHQELLGTLTINVSEYVNDKKPVDLRFLLERSKTNTIVKLSLFVRPLSNDYDVSYKTTSHTESPSVLCNEMSLSPKKSKSTLISSSSISSHGRSFTVPSPTAAKSPTIDKLINRKSSIKNTSSSGYQSRTYQKSLTSPTSTMFMSSIQSSNQVPSPQQQGTQSPTELSNIHKDLQTQKLMNEACESAINEISLLDEMINKSYKFTWQISSMKYEEFSPAESVKDIIEKNGNGWKKNEEGIDMVDVIENEYRESSNLNGNNGRINSTRGFKFLNTTDDNEIFTNFQDFDNVGNQLKNDDDDTQSESESESESDELFYSYYKDGSTNRKNSKIKRFKPLTEAEVREDLRSWKISVE